MTYEPDLKSESRKTRYLFFSDCALAGIPYSWNSVYIFMKVQSIYGRNFHFGHRVVLEISLVFYRSHHENFESANSERAFKKWCNSHIGNKRMCNARCRSSSCECFDTLRTRVCFSNSDGATRVECSCSSSSAHFRTYQRSHHTNVIVTMWG